MTEIRRPHHLEFSRPLNKGFSGIHPIYYKALVRHPPDSWRTTPCPRCGFLHPRYCPDCPNHPPCADHVCSWPEDEDEE